ncbi:hypothetical protein Bca4012_032367 [Brassica carinata]|uniref:Uncharacterized protein n=3 Tax=Brassica TaxID=3705 RepID=A0A0D3BZQ7_BRAOL|nr:unnamed protein product [Brassica napus]CDY37889.1 BnaC04g31170D [Brassica napus]
MLASQSRYGIAELYKADSSNFQLPVFMENVRLDAVAHEISWVGPESMVIKPTEYKKLVEQHGFKSICYVDFPSREEALKILCGFDF